MQKIIRKLLFSDSPEEENSLPNPAADSEIEQAAEQKGKLPESSAPGTVTPQNINSKDKPGTEEEKTAAEGAAVETGEEASSELDPLQTAPLAPLPPELQGHESPMLRRRPASERNFEPYLQVARRSHVGAERPRNEDACFVFTAQTGGHDVMPPFGLFVVADGMGGYEDGHKASKIVSRTVAQQVLTKIYQPMLRDENVGSREPIQEVMEEAVHLANKALYIPDPDKVMGTTLTAALILGRRLFLVHIGDSRAYLLKGQELTPITTDHSIVQALQDAGQLTAEEAATHQNRGLLYKALMGDELEQVDTYTQALPKEGMLMLCSDGLWGLISEEVISEVLLDEDLSLQDKVESLVDKALEAGGYDNITAVLINFAV